MRKTTRVLAGLALLGSLAGCAIFQPAPPIKGHRDLKAGSEISVGKGQNVYAIARKHGVPMRDLIAINRLRPPFALRTGQRLVLPLKAGEIAPSTEPVSFQPHDPASGPGFAAGAVTAVPLEPLKPQPVETAPVTAMTPSTPIPLRKPSEPEPVVAQQAEPKPVPMVVKEEPVPARAERRLGALAVPAASSSPPAAPPAAPQPSPPSRLASVVAPVPAAPPAATTHPSLPPATAFVWPVQGSVLAGFGARGAGVGNDGINIAAPKGAPVVAAGSGIVVYAGNEMKGYGNLVLIRHEGGWVTAYAHLERLMVGRDTVVAAGDMIGTVGATGGASSPQLHFETRHDGKPTDPRTVLPR